MNDLQATAQARAVHVPVATRGAVERFGLVTIAAGIVVATLVAWLLTKVSWGVDRHIEGVSLRFDRFGNIDPYRSGWGHFVEQHVWAEGAFYVGIGLVVLGVVMVLVGKALRRTS